jgi:hypothetical protein
LPQVDYLAGESHLKVYQLYLHNLILVIGFHFGCHQLFITTFPQEGSDVDAHYPTISI